MHFRISTDGPRPRLTGRGPAAAYSFGVVLLVGLPACFVLAFWADPLGPPLALAITLFMGALVAFLVTGLVVRAGRGLVLHPTDGGVVLPGSRLRAGLFVLSCLAGAVFLASIVVAALLGEESGSVTFVVLGGLVLVCGVPAAWALVRGRYRMNQLQLTPEEVRYRSYAGEHVLTWDDILDVELVPDPRARIVLTGRSEPQVTMRTRAIGGGPAAGATLPNEIGVPVIIMASGAAPMAELLDFYRRHPRLRGELGSHAVLERLRSGVLELG